MRKESAKSSNESANTDRLEEEGFFRRWSSRKRRARRGEAEESVPAPPSEKAKPDQVGESTESDEPERVLTDADMPAIESLNEDSDYSPFMSPGVSDALRKLALRKMFLSSKYNFTDGLDDYADDFTKFAPLGNIVTADMRHQMEMQAQRAKEKLEEEARTVMDEASTDEGAEADTAAAEPPAVEPTEPERASAAGGESSADEDTGDLGSGDDTRSG